MTRGLGQTSAVTPAPQPSLTAATWITLGLFVAGIAYVAYDYYSQSDAPPAPYVPPPPSERVGVSTFKSTYKTLARALGSPNGKGDDYKISTTWNVNGVEVYDYKETSLYSDSLPTPDQLRSSSKRVTWHVQGTKNDRKAFFGNLKSKTRAGSISATRMGN